MYKPINSLLFLLVAFAGCTGRIEDRLIQEANQACSGTTKSECPVALNIVTPFEWERVYFFDSWTPADSIQRVIGFGYLGDGVEDDYTRMVFTKGTAVVHEEDFHKFDYQSATISISEIADSLSQAKIPFLTPNNALLLAQKDKVKEAGCAECFYYSFSVKN